MTIPPAADTYLRQGSPNQNEGTDTALRIQSSGHNRVLVRFDQEAIETILVGRTLILATLELSIADLADNWGSTGRRVDAHRLTEGWTELGATWNCSVDQVPGNQQAECNAQWNGGSYAATPTASVLHVNGQVGVVRFEVTSDVAAFLGGMPNDGWLLKKTNEGQAGKVEYSSREVGSASRPRLVLEVEHTPVGDATPPNLAIVEPASPLVVDQDSPTVAVTFNDADSAIDEPTLRVEVDGIEITASCLVTNGEATCTPPSLLAGEHVARAEVADVVGNLAEQVRGFTIVLDQTAPVVVIVSPDRPVVVGDSSPEIRVVYGDLDSGIDVGSVRIEVDSTDITANCGVGEEEAVCEAGILAHGRHVVAATVADHRGNTGSSSAAFDLVFPISVDITFPQQDTVLPVAVTRVEGEVDPEALAVEVNGVQASIGGGSFLVESLGLHDGANQIVAVARDGAGNIGTSALRVFADTSPPTLAISYPVDGSFVSEESLVVTGLVNDLTIGTVSQTDVDVEVNGFSATVVNRSFLVEGVPLVPGLNTLTAEVTDHAGNRGVATVTVTRLARSGVSNISVVSGNAQVGTIAEPLPEPLVVQVLDGQGQPLQSAEVVFRVAGGNGAFPDDRRLARKVTDEDGKAGTSFILGTRAGVGVNRIIATAVGVVGGVTFTAISREGSPRAIHVVSGNNQWGSVGSELPRPLVAVVFDQGNNPIGGVPVTFRLASGGGDLEGSDEVTVVTDSSGLAFARLRVGLIPGFDNQFVEASFPDLETETAVFKASALLAGDPGNTEIAGVVLDNQGSPVPGVSLRIRESQLAGTTNSFGEFQISGLLPARVFLIVDASTTTLPGHWASLEFELFPVPGRHNTLEKPVYVLPVDISHGVFVDETQGGTVTVPELPGLGLEVTPGSVTFPGGGRSGVVSMTAVHADRIPMAPGAGMQPRLIVTIQPAGARFNPPAPFTLPNVDGYLPGTITELFSFDHDLGAFVAIGTGTVSEDGLLVRSNPGFGIIEAGWHCGSQPSGSGGGGSLQVTLKPQPVKIQYGSTTTLTAEGRPPKDGEYLEWRILSSNVDNELRFSGQPKCPGEESCNNILVSLELALTGEDHLQMIVCGTAVAAVNFHCTTNDKTTQGTVTIEQGCAGRSAAECRNLCTAVRAQGMCGTPCELTGTSTAPYNRTTDSCWRTRVGEVDYCYWDARAPGGPGFENLCCANHCFEEAFTVWGQPASSGPYICTVVERCDTNPAFEGAECTRAN